MIARTRLCATFLILSGGLTGLTVATLASRLDAALAPAGNDTPPVSPASKDSLNKRYHDIVAKYQTAPETQPDAWSALIDALETVKTAEKPFRQADGPYLPNHDVPDFSAVFSSSDLAEDKAAGAMARKVLAAYDQAGVWPKLDVVASRMRCVRPAFDSPDDRRLKGAVTWSEPDVWSGRLTEVLLPEAGTMRNLTRAAAAHMYLAVEKKDWPAVAADYRRMLALSRVCSHDGVLIMRLVGIAIGELAHNRAAAAISVAGANPPAALIEGLRAALTEQLATVPSFTLHIEAERLIAEDSLTDAFDKNGKVKLNWMNQMQAMRGEGATKGGLDGIEKPEQNETVKKLREVYDALERWAGAPWYDNQAQDAELTRQLSEANTKSKYMMLTVLVPAIHTARMSHLDSLASLAGMTAALDVYAYRLKNGSFPKTLEALGDGKTSSYKDPYSGKPLIYKFRADSTSFELWAVGYDRTDDGGKLHPKEPLTAATAKGAGFDLRKWPRGGK